MNRAKQITFLFLMNGAVFSVLHSSQADLKSDAAAAVTYCPHLEACKALNRLMCQEQRDVQRTIQLSAVAKAIAEMNGKTMHNGRTKIGQIDGNTVCNQFLKDSIGAVVSVRSAPRVTDLYFQAIDAQNKPTNIGCIVTIEFGAYIPSEPCAWYGCTVGADGQ